MAVLDMRWRTGWLFAMVTVGHVVLISVQVTTKQGVPLLEEAVFGLFADVQRFASQGTGAVGSTWSHYLALRDTDRQNGELRQENAQLRIGLQRERALAQQTRALQQLLSLRATLELSTTAANVIAGGASPDFRTITIDKGTDAGLRANMAVVAPEGVVGRVILPSARAAKVQLLIDRNAGAGALVERSRAQGVIVGTGSSQLRLEYVSDTADIKVGDLVVTSGTEGIYPASTVAGEIPKGFVIGRIESIERSGSGSRVILVRPTVDFTSLEVVLAVTGIASAAETAAPAPPAPLPAFSPAGAVGDHE